jgi:hypothetical protein
VHDISEQASRKCISPRAPGGPKVCRHVRQWETFLNSDLIHAHGREDLEPDLHEAPPGEDVLDRLFEPASERIWTNKLHSYVQYMNEPHIPRVLR